MENTDSEYFDPKVQKRVCIAIIFLAILSLGSCKSSKEASLTDPGNDNKLTLVPFEIEKVKDAETIPAELKHDVQFWTSNVDSFYLSLRTFVKTKTITPDGRFKFLDIPVTNEEIIPPRSRCVIDSISNDMKIVFARLDSLDASSSAKFVFDPKDKHLHLFAEKKNKDGTYTISYKNDKYVMNSSYYSIILLYYQEQGILPDKHRHVVTGVSVK